MVVLNTFTHDARVMKEAKTLQSCGHRVTVNALGAEDLPSRETIEGISVRRVRLRSREGTHVFMAAWVELLPKFVSAISVQRPDICHAHDLNALIPAYLAARLTNARLIYDSHEYHMGRKTIMRLAGWKRWMWRQSEALLARRADSVITVSSSIASELAHLYSIRLPAVVRNCPDLIELPPPGTLRSRLGLSDGRPIVLYQGGLLRERGLESLVRAVAQVPEAILVMLGTGPLHSTLGALALELESAGQVYLPGRVPWHRLLQYTRDASIGICLTENTCLNHYYSLPNKVFEYLMAGVPVLASDLPEIGKVLLTADAGMLVDPANVDAIAGALRAMLADREALTEMGRRAREAAVQRYNWDHEAEILLGVYERCIDAGSR